MIETIKPSANIFDTGLKLLHDLGLFKYYVYIYFGYLACTLYIRGCFSDI